MEQPDWDQEFQQIVESIDMSDVPGDPPASIPIGELNQAVLRLTEAAMYLSRFIDQLLQEQAHLEFPVELAESLREATRFADEISDALADCHCPDCAPDCIHCDDGGICEDCAQEILEEWDEGDSS